MSFSSSLKRSNEKQESLVDDGEEKKVEHSLTHASER